MLERLYCADFAPVLGERFRYPFDLPAVDALVWPLFEGEPLPESTRALLDLERDGHPLFYRRRLTLAEYASELYCAGLGRALLQGADLGGGEGAPGISNELVWNLASMHPETFAPVPSVDYSHDDSVEGVVKRLDWAAGVVVYPTHVREPLVAGGTTGTGVAAGTPGGDPPGPLERLIGELERRGVPLKVDLGLDYLPGSDRRLVTPEVLDWFAQRHPDLKVVVSGLDLGDLPRYLTVVKFRRNVALEFDPRATGGASPGRFFVEAFGLPGFVQTCWNRFVLGSATPTLEASQVVRGWWEATDQLPLAQKHVLRIWGFRAAHLWYATLGAEPVVGAKPGSEPASSREATLDHRSSRPAPFELVEHVVASHLEEPPAHLRVLLTFRVHAFSVTQLLWLKPLVDFVEELLRSQYPDLPEGELTFRTTHTTTCLLLNEHEPGNYLELHYHFVEQTTRPPDDAMHTVAAAENRADFNFPDHLAAATFGQRDVTIPYHGGRLLLGGRESLYVLSTFGPRTLTLRVTCKLDRQS
ncbi:MAG: hypothetical protein Kow0069_23570 [Promethearchaeota archaeon]